MYMLYIHTHRRKFISDMLNTLVTEKFGNRSMDDDFSGPSDAADAPFHLNYGGNDYIITATGDDSSNVDQLPVSAPCNISGIIARN